MKKVNAKNKKAIITIIVVAVVLFVLLGIYLFSKKTNDLEAGLLSNRPPVVTYKASDVNLLQNFGSEVKFDAKFKTYGSKQYYYKWVTYKDGGKSSETECKPVTNGMLDNQTLKIDAKYNYGKWGIYSNDRCTLQSMVYYTLTYTAKDLINSDYGVLVANLYRNTAKSIGANRKSCNKNEDGSCSVTLPTIEARSGYEVVGWNTRIDGKGESYNPGDELTLTKDVNLYAITKRKAGSSIIPKPTTTNSNVTTTTPGDSNGIPPIGTTTESGKERTITVTFIRSDNSLGVKMNKEDQNYESRLKSTCTTRGEYCMVKVPYLVPKEGYVASGWSSHTYTLIPSFKEGILLPVKYDTTFYGVTRKKIVGKINVKNIPRALNQGDVKSLNIDVEPKTDSYKVESSDESVVAVNNDVLYATGTGTAELKITTYPSNVVETVSVNVGPMAANNEGATSNSNSSFRKGIAKEYKRGKVKIKIENGCGAKGEEIANQINSVPQYILDTTGSISIFTKESYELNNVPSAGITYGFGPFSYININCNAGNKATVYHEIGHAVDYYMRGRALRIKFSNRKDAMKLYNKYKNTSKITNFSKVHQAEFYAESIHHLLVKYYDKTMTEQQKQSYLNLFPKDVEEMVIGNIWELYNFKKRFPFL